jgi:CBS domain containing-hemolysin-like protein
MLVAGLLLSAFFSGSETGFYRATRVRLALDALGGDPFARGILWLANNPALFVATTLIGNNLANYLVSLAIVLLTTSVLSHGSLTAELLGPVVFSPLVFVYGELLPKNLFYHAPNKLLRLCGPVFLIFTLLFAPVAAVLWAAARLLQWVLGENPEQVQLSLARRELQRVLEEGHEAGVLQPMQRAVALNLFAVENQRVEQFCTPAARVVSVRQGASIAEVLRLARRQRVSVVPVTGEKGRRIIGYVRVTELRRAAVDRLDRVQPLLEISADEKHIVALTRMRSARQPMAGVVDASGQFLGVVYAERLIEPLLRSE